MEGLTIFDLALWFLNREKMTHKKLQKLCYYAYSWFLYFNNESIDNLENKIFNEKFEAWVHGPCQPELYKKYKEYSFKVIDCNVEIDLIKFLDYEEFLNEIFEAYGSYTGDELETITHSEMPWKNARKGLEPWQIGNNIIKDTDIFMEFAARYEN